jgi:uncharacterized membrane protein YbaN (DUF454 family)
MERSTRRWLRWLLVAAGFLFVGLGVVGAFLPLLPTTPFLLLAAACFARSSERFYNWLVNNKWFGTYVRDYREGRGIPVRIKIITVGALWVVICLSAVFAVSNLFVRIILFIIAAAVTAHILSIRPRKGGGGESPDTE